MQATQHELAHPPLRAGQTLGLQLQRAGARSVRRAQDDAVAQVVKDHGLVGAIDHVTGIGHAALFGCHLFGHEGHAQAQGLIDRAHELAVALHQVVVDGDDMRGPAGQGAGAGGQGGREGLAFAGLHFGHHALHHDPATHQLHIEVALAQGEFGRAPHQGKSLGHVGIGGAFSAQGHGHLTRALTQGGRRDLAHGLFGGCHLGGKAQGA